MPCRANAAWINYTGVSIEQSWKTCIHPEDLAACEVAQSGTDIDVRIRAGHGEESMTPLSVNYCQRARVHLASIDSPLAATITPASLVAVARESVAEAGAHPNESLRAGGRMKTGQAFWTAFQARFELIGARSAKDQMGVTIHKTRGKHATRATGAAGAYKAR